MTDHLGSTWSCRRGFTLIEMLIVLSIIGVVITMVGTRNTVVIDRSRDAALMIQCQNYRNAIHQFVLETTGRFPETLMELVPRQMPKMTDEWIGSKARGKIFYDKATGRINLYNQAGSALETALDSKGRAYGEY